MHTPVLLKDVIEVLAVKKGKKYIDATFGEGGHSKEILKLGGKVLGIEWDEEKLKAESLKLKTYKHLKLVWGNFKDIEKIAKANNFYPVDGVLFDLGLSMEQIENSGRGFSYKKLSEPLDMRISRSLTRKAVDIVNSFSAQELYEIFTKNSEEINSWAIAKIIVRSRTLKKIETVGDLVRVIHLSRLRGKKEEILKRVFQALRIEVNNEFESLKKGLEGAVKVLDGSGRVVVITFHSLEDRIVKQFVKKNKLKFITQKPIITRSEKRFERSAKIRVFGFN